MKKQKSYSRIGGSSKVYDDDAFAYRVNFAATVICSGGSATRNFDTCFEMYDGHAVAEAIRRRSPHQSEVSRERLAIHRAGDGRRPGENRGVRAPDITPASPGRSSRARRGRSPQRRHVRGNRKRKQ